MRPSSLLRSALLIFTFVLTLIIRVRGVTEHFQLLGDQIRDWGIALRPFRDLPLVGPPTHLHGYAIGPAFYWIMWAIRVTVGPWYQNLPHAGGIGQSILQSAADTVLLVAIWRRTGSVWIAAGVITLVATASFDLALASVIWNPVIGSVLAKAATALVLLDYHRRSLIHAVVAAVLAWSAVHAHIGAIFVTAGVFAAFLIDPFLRGERQIVRRNALILLLVVAFLQLPYVMYQIRQNFRDRALGAVTVGIAAIVSGSEQPQVAKSVLGYVAAVEQIQVSPWRLSITGWVLLACAALVGFRYHRDRALLSTIIVPQFLAVLGYAFFLGPSDSYYYLPLMPAVALTVVLAIVPAKSTRVANAIGVALCTGVLLLVPGRIRQAANLFRMPNYKVLVDGSRKIVNLHQPVRAIHTEFQLEWTADPQFVYSILGGRIDPHSRLVAVIKSDGSVGFENVDGA